MIHDLAFMIDGQAEGNLHRHSRALAWMALNAQLASQQFRPLAHAAQANRLRAGNLGLGNAQAIVFDLQEEAAILPAQLHLDPGGPGVADDIGQSLLENAEEGRGQFLV